MIDQNQKSFLSVKDLFQVLREVNVPSFLDKWGPEYVIQVYDPEIKMQGFLVIDNTALGPGVGGIKISPSITPLEIFKLSRKMTWKCALADIPFGGAKAGIRANPDVIDETHYIHSFAKKISPYVPNRYIAAPEEDIGQKEMEIFVNAVGDMQAAIGKPERLGGIPHESGTIGFGVGVAIEAGLEIIHDLVHLPPDLSEARVAIQGFGQVGLSVGRYLDSKGARIVALGDHWGVIFNPEGIDFARAKKYSSLANQKMSLKSYSENGFHRLKREEIFGIDCDIFVNCACNSAINVETYLELKAKYVIEATNNVTEHSAEQTLHNHGKIVIPDLLANMGGIIAAYAEHARMDVGQAFSLIESKMKKNTEAVLLRSIETGLQPRLVANKIAKERVKEVMEGKL